MYVAACAFLLETASHKSATSRPRTPEAVLQSPPDFDRTSSFAIDHDIDRARNGKVALDHANVESGQTHAGHARHTLLGAAANRDYQRCYKALKLLEKYWAGTRYIVTVLDQKAKGVLDPLLYDVEDLHRMVQIPESKPSVGLPDTQRNTSRKKSSGMAAAGYLANLSRLKPIQNSSLRNENLSKLNPSQGQLAQISIFKMT